MEKSSLERKHACTSAIHVRQIGRNPDRIFRFLPPQSGAVIQVENGKKTFPRWMDDRRNCAAKSQKSLPWIYPLLTPVGWKSIFLKVRIVFDHFHITKPMNERLDKLRGRYAAELDASQRIQFQKLRMSFPRNMEDQDADTLPILRSMRKYFQEWSDACLLKEALRSIYATASNVLEARAAFRRWATLAAATEGRELIAMAKTIHEKLPGIITDWTFDRMGNASTEEFNNKIRWFIRQAFGFREITYPKWKIFQLPLYSTSEGAMIYGSNRRRGRTLPVRNFYDFRSPHTLWMIHSANAEFPFNSQAPVQLIQQAFYTRPRSPVFRENPIPCVLVTSPDRPTSILLADVDSPIIYQSFIIAFLSTNLSDAEKAFFLHSILTFAVDCGIISLK